MDWDLKILIDGEDRTAEAAGRVWRRQEANAAHLCRLALHVPSGQAMAVDTMIGLSVEVQARIDGGAWSPRFSGFIVGAAPDTRDGLVRLDASDRLQQYFEGLELDDILALMPGARWDAYLYANGGARADGWRQAQDCMGTLPYSYHVDRTETHRWLPWAVGATDYTLAAGAIYEDGISIERPDARERINAIAGTLHVRWPILYHWAYSGSWGLYDDDGGFCEYVLLDDSEAAILPPMQAVDSAIRSTGPIQVASGTLGAMWGSGGGVAYRRFPPSGGYTCGETPVTWSDDGSVVGASWTWAVRWRQVLTMRYDIGVTAPDSIAAWGAEGMEDSAMLSGEDDFQEWEQSAGDVGAPSGGGWADSGGAKRWITADAAHETDFLETAIAEWITRILSGHRGTCATQCPPGAAAMAVEIGDTVSVASQQKGCIATVGAIEEYWDLDDWDAQTTLILRPSRCPGAGGTTDPVSAPSRPDLSAPATLDTSASFPSRIGGVVDAPAYDGDWLGLTTNVKAPVEGEELYPFRVVFEIPAIPDALRDEWVATQAPIVIEVYPPNDYLLEVAE